MSRKSKFWTRLTLLGCVAFGAIAAVMYRANEEQNVVSEQDPVKALHDHILSNSYRAVPEKCKEQILAMVAAHVREKEYKKASSMLSELKSNGCIQDRHFALMQEPEKPYGKCLGFYDFVMGATVEAPIEARELPKSVLHVRIKDFRWYEHTCRGHAIVIARMVEELKETLGREGHLILDFRGNPGGLSSVVRMFVEALFSPTIGSALDTVITSTGVKTTRYTKRIGALQCPAVSLIDKHTASAAEMAVGILREWCPDMLLIGESRSYGKGTGTPRLYAEGVGVALSAAEFMVGTPPYLVKIEGVGIEPDVYPSFYSSSDPRSCTFAKCAPYLIGPAPVQMGDPVLDLALEMLRQPKLARSLAQRSREMRRTSVHYKSVR